MEILQRRDSRHGVLKMKIEFEFDDDELREAVKEVIIETMRKRIVGQAFGEGRMYRDFTKQAVREAIRGDIDNLSNRAVAAAAKSIENRAVKKLIDKLEATE